MGPFLVATLLLVAPASAPTPVDPWEADIQRFEQADLTNPPAPGGVLFLGSSSIRMWETLAEDFAGAPVVNRGFGGSEIADSTRFVGRIVVPHRPRLIVLYAGDNDLVNGKTPTQVATDFEAFVARVRRDLPGTRTAFISIKPSPARAALIDAARVANGLIRDTIDRDRRLSYINVFTPMLDADGKPRPELFGEDGLHLNAAGYALWTRLVKPHLSGNGRARGGR